MGTEIMAGTRADQAVTEVTPLRAGDPIAVQAAALEDTVVAVVGVATVAAVAGTVVAVAAGAAVRTGAEATAEGIRGKRIKTRVSPALPLPMEVPQSMMICPFLSGGCPVTDNS